MWFENKHCPATDNQNTAIKKQQQQEQPKRQKRPPPNDRQYTSYPSHSSITRYSLPYNFPSPCNLTRHNLLEEPGGRLEDFLPVPYRPPQDAPQHVAAAIVGGHGSVRDGEGQSSGMVGDNPGRVERRGGGYLSGSIGIGTTVMGLDVRDMTNTQVQSTL